MKYYYSEELGCYKPTPEQPRLTALQLLEIFPEALEIIPAKVKEWESAKRRIVKQSKSFLQSTRQVNGFSGWFWREAIGIMVSSEPWEQLKRLNGLRLLCKGPKEKKALMDRQAKVEQARARSLLDLYPFEKVKRNYSRTMVSCPIHGERTASMVIYPNNSFYCFGCQKGGDAIEFIMQLKGCDFNAALEVLT